mgnify:CR=1 FL=1
MHKIYAVIFYLIHRSVLNIRQRKAKAQWRKGSTAKNVLCITGDRRCYAGYLNYAIIQFSCCNNANKSNHQSNPVLKLNAQVTCNNEANVSERAQYE